MSDADDNSEQQPSESEPEGPLCGERLAEARSELQISLLEIAKELHLDEPKVRALERNEFETLGAPVFAKGHLRKYAQLVDVDEADVLTDYYRLTRKEAMPPLVSSRPRPRREMSPGPWIAVIVVIIVVASAYWWITSRPVAIEPPQPELIPEGPVALPQPDSADVEVDETADPESVIEEPLPSEPETEPAPALDDDQLRMLITYSGDCWTEISDANGRRLFFALGTDGRTVELSGEAPFNVLFGNADNVSLEVNGTDYPIPASGRRGRTARLTISGP